MQCKRTTIGLLANKSIRVSAKEISSAFDANENTISKADTIAKHNGDIKE
jgi:hypothetical protein